MIVSVSVLEHAARALKNLMLAGTEFDSTRAQREMRRAGCPAALGDTILDVLISAGFVQITPVGETLRLTDAGRSAAVALWEQVWSEYAAGLLALPMLQEQLHASLSAVSVDAQGSVADRRAVAGRWPTLGVVIGWLPSVPDHAGGARLPDHWLDRLHFVTGHTQIPAWVQLNADVGGRAERYSLHLERSRIAPSAVLWVASESDRYGYDIEVRQSGRILRAIEVKGSSTGRRRFYLSAHEFDVAARLGDQYVVQFWGDVDAESDMAEEYVRLRADGYPIEYVNPAELVATGDLSMQASTWQVEDESE